MNEFFSKPRLSVSGINKNSTVGSLYEFQGMLHKNPWFIMLPRGKGG